MKSILRALIVILLITGIGAAAYNPAMQYWKKRNEPTWREVEVERGRIVSVVNSTGTVKPVLSVSVGAVVSGPIIELHADFNDEVKEGQLLARIDPRLFKANVDRDQAVLSTRLADVERVEALLQQALNDESRAKALHAENEDYISQSEMDQVKFSVLSLQAQLDVAKASVQQSEGSLENSLANLEYTQIRSPVDGMVIDRKIDEGQSLASQFQTPELFIVAPDMRKNMYVFASVDEADIGMIRAAQKEGRPVQFSVDAYPEDVFHGEIEQIRMSSTTTQNVVTYPVVVTAPNPDLKLMPGMTADISFEVAAREDVVKIPNAALRFYPDAEFVRQEDRQLLEGAALETEEESDSQAGMTASKKAEAKRKRRHRHVWVADQEGLRAVEVVMGLVDNQHSELLEGDLQPGQKLVAGMKPKS